MLFDNMFNKNNLYGVYIKMIKENDNFLFFQEAENIIKSRKSFRSVTFDFENYCIEAIIDKFKIEIRLENIKNDYTVICTCGDDYCSHSLALVLKLLGKESGTNNSFRNLEKLSKYDEDSYYEHNDEEKNIKKIFISQNLISAVDRSVFKRGLEYYRDGKVKVLDFLAKSKVLAVVKGKEENYDVILTLQNDIVLSQCNCVFFHVNNSICKHIVAASLECDRKNKYVDPYGNTVDEEIRNQFIKREKKEPIEEIRTQSSIDTRDIHSKTKFDKNDIKFSFNKFNKRDNFEEKNESDKFLEYITYKKDSKFEKNEKFDLNTNKSKNKEQKKIKRKIKINKKDEKNKQKYTLNQIINSSSRNSSNASKHSNISKFSNNSFSTKSIITIRSVELVDIEKQTLKNIKLGSTFSRLDPVTYNSVKSSLDKIKVLQYSQDFDPVYSARKIVSIFIKTTKAILNKIKQNFRDKIENNKIFTLLTKFGTNDIITFVDDDFQLVEKKVVPLLKKGFELFSSKLDDTHLELLKNDIFENTSKEVLFNLET